MEALEKALKTRFLVRILSVFSGAWIFMKYLLQFSLRLGDIFISGC